MKAYRFLTGPDDSEFCKRITAHLNDGWVLAGPGSLTYDPIKKEVICGQPITKEVSDIEYSDKIDLSNF